MPDIAQGNNAKLILAPGEVYRVTAVGTATVQAAYGAPSGTTTVTAASRDFGPYDAHAKLVLTAVSGPVNYQLRQGMSPVLVDDDDQLFTPDGQPVGGGVIRPSGMVRARVNSASGFAANDTSSWRQIWQIPTTGLVAVRAGVETSSTTPVARTCAFASGRSIFDTNPVDPSGSGAAWQVTASFTPTASAADQATTGANGVGLSEWKVINVIPQIDDNTGGGYVYVGCRQAGNEVGIVGNASRPTSVWGDVVNAILPAMKYRQFHQAGGDYVTVNQNTMPAKTVDGYYAGVSWLDYIPVKRTFWGVNIGDSTSQGLGGSTADSPYNMNWGHVAANDLILSGTAVQISNFGYEGKPVTYFLGEPGAAAGRLALLVADADFRPSFVVIQSFSLNGSGFDQANIDAGMRAAILWCKKLRELGIVPILRTVIPSSTVDAAANTRRITANNQIRASGEVIFDLDAIVSNAAGDAILSTYTYDGTHLDRDGNEIGARHPTLGFAAVLRRLIA